MDLLIRKLPFTQLVQELSQEYHPQNLTTESYSWEGLAIGPLQEASEYMLVGLLEGTNLCAIHAKHVMILLQDLQLAIHL